MKTLLDPLTVVSKWERWVTLLENKTFIAGTSLSKSTDGSPLTLVGVFLHFWQKFNNQTLSLMINNDAPILFSAFLIRIVVMSRESNILLRQDVFS